MAHDGTAAPAGAQTTIKAPTVAIIGTGFGGLGMGYYLKQAGIDSFTIYEKADEVGGVWRENTYPGAACDVPSHLYSFAFEPHYPWTRRYGPQREILAYLRHVADKYDLRRHVRFGCEVRGADFDEARGVWTLHLADGSTAEANVLIPAVGQLHQPQIPPIPGIEKFEGRAFHSARWEHDCDFTAKTVAVIGTGPSAVQFVPELARQVKRMVLYQRSPGWCIPKFDRAYMAHERWLLDHVPLVHDLDRGRVFWTIEYLASALQKNSRINFLSKAIFRNASRILMRLQVRDPALRAKLTPDSPVGCKRTLLSNDWLKALALPNVEVVTEPVVGATASGLLSGEDRTERAVDAIVYGTGFASTRFLAPMRIRGLDGQTLDDRWQHRAAAYMGITVSGFPNLFIVYGPNTNLGAGSIIYMLEREQRYIAQAVAALRDRGLRYLDVRPEAEHDFIREVDDRSAELVYTDGCQNWYLTNGLNTNNWVGYMNEYGRRLKRFDVERYHAVEAAAPRTTHAA